MFYTTNFSFHSEKLNQFVCCCVLHLSEIDKGIRMDLEHTKMKKGAGVLNYDLLTESSD